MQLGTRWSVGATPPANLPEAVLAAVAGVEKELSGTDTTQWRWTLTWLEGKPVCELDDGTVIRYDGEHAAVIPVD
jgi:hypothetical protein